MTIALIEGLAGIPFNSVFTTSPCGFLGPLAPISELKKHPICLDNWVTLNIKSRFWNSSFNYRSLPQSPMNWTTDRFLIWTKIPWSQTMGAFRHHSQTRKKHVWGCIQVSSSRPDLRSLILIVRMCLPSLASQPAVLFLSLIHISEPTRHS